MCTSANAATADDECKGAIRVKPPMRLGAASTHLGPQAVALIVLLNKQFGLSHGKIATLLRDWSACTYDRVA
jgi:hypothetical protein